MFGVVPKSIWSRSNPADANNLIRLCMRSLLIRNGAKLILVDTGIGTKQDAKFLSYYHLHGEDSLDRSLSKAGYQRNEITDVFQTHLHLDHCGGTTEWSDSGGTRARPSFPNARIWSNQAHWEWATQPNARERASFRKENLQPIEASGQLSFVERKGDISRDVFGQIDVLFVDGHTESQMLPLLHYKGHKILFAADLLPTVGHIALPYVMGYDTRPLLTMEERERIFRQCADEGIILFLEHDPLHECCTLQHTEKGVRVKDCFRLCEL